MMQSSTVLRNLYRLLFAATVDLRLPPGICQVPSTRYVKPRTEAVSRGLPLYAYVSRPTLLSSANFVGSCDSLCYQIPVFGHDCHRKPSSTSTYANVCASVNTQWNVLPVSTRYNPTRRHVLPKAPWYSIRDRINLFAH